MIINTVDDLSGVPTSMTLNDPEPAKWIFRKFLAILVCDAHLKIESSPKLLQINKDNPRMKVN